MIRKMCSKCGYEIPADSLICPRCNRYCGTEENTTRNRDFQIWEGEYSSSQDRSVSSSYSYASQKKTTPVSNKEACKCLGKIEGIACNTYYFVSSVKNHGGCARRDCSNSFENNPKIIFGKSEYTHNTSSEADYSRNVILGLLGVAIVIMGGVAENLGIAIVGGLFVLLAFIIPAQEKIEKILMKVNFQLVPIHEIPTHAKDPWTQQNIKKSEKMTGLNQKKSVQNKFVDFSVNTNKESIPASSNEGSMSEKGVSHEIDFHVKKRLKSKLDRGEITKTEYVQKLKNLGVNISEQERTPENSDRIQGRSTDSRSEIFSDADLLFEKLDEKLSQGKLDKSQYLQKIQDLNISPQNESIKRLFLKFKNGVIDEREYLMKKKDIEGGYLRWGQ
jgi:hypothetical protein